MKGHTNRVISVAFSPNGKAIASCSYDKTIRVWDASTGQCLHTLSGHSSRVWSVAFSPDGQTIASGSEDQTIKIWDVNTGQCLKTLTGQSSWIISITFSPNHQSLHKCTSGIAAEGERYYSRLSLQLHRQSIHQRT